MGWIEIRASPSSVILPADHIPFQKSVSQYKETCLLILDPDQIYFLILSNFHINSSAKVHIYMYCMCGQSIHKNMLQYFTGERWNNYLVRPAISSQQLTAISSQQLTAKSLQ